MIFAKFLKRPFYRAPLLAYSHWSVLSFFVVDDDDDDDDDDDNNKLFLWNG